MSRELVMETLKVLPQDFEMSEFLEALYERISAMQGIINVQLGNEMPIEDVIEEFSNESSNNW